jgi:hypothetical protein
MAEWCQWDGCEKPAMQGDHPYCSMHTKRQQRGTPMNAPEREILPPFERLVQASIDLADADSDDDGEYNRAESRLKAAAKCWVERGAQNMSDGERDMLAMLLARVEARKRHMRKICREGGLARMRRESPADRAMIARRAAEARWKGRK